MNVLNPGKFDQNKFWFYPQNQITDVFKIAWFVLKCRFCKKLLLSEWNFAKLPGTFLAQFSLGKCHGNKNRNSVGISS